MSVLSRPVDYIATAESYGVRIQTRAEFEADPDRYPGLLERAAEFPGSHVLWETESDIDCFMLVGDGREALAREWFRTDFASYGTEFQKVTYAEGCA